MTEAAAAAHHPEQVTVTLTVVNNEGQSHDESKSIDAGPTKVTELKVELGVAAEDALWVTEKNGKPKQLADHETHNVKAGDHYRAIVKGGVS